MISLLARPRVPSLLPIIPTVLSVMLISVWSGCKSDLPEQIQLGDKFSQGNPEPTPRDFREINKRHKIIMAVMDSGIDYNHPELIPNVHFDLDAQGKPTRDAQGRLNSLGKDYVGMDDCASWRIVDTNAFPFDKRVKDAQDDIRDNDLPETYDHYASLQVRRRECVLKAVTSVSPAAKGIAKYIGPYRNAEFDEDGSNIHGTHVAGLMTYDRPDFGVIPYRVLRNYRTKEQIKAETREQGDLFMKNFAEALVHAREHHVKIVNLSLGGSFDAPDDTKTPEADRRYKKFLREKENISQYMTATIRKYPEMLFVAAAGNDSGRSDNSTRIQFPCGLDDVANNLLCVGALNPDGRRASFTNLPFNRDLSMVYAPGYEIISLKVSDTCPTLTGALRGLQSDEDWELCKLDPATDHYRKNDAALKRFSAIITDYARLCETSYNRYMRMSGTSMATPLVSHMAAEIWVKHPEIKLGKDIIPLLTQNFALKNVEGADDIPPGSLSPKLPRWNHGEPFFNASWDPAHLMREPSEGVPSADAPTPPKATKPGDKPQEKEKDKNDDGSGFQWDLGVPGHLPLPAGLAQTQSTGPSARSVQ